LDGIINLISVQLDILEAMHPAILMNKVVAMRRQLNMTSIWVVKYHCSRGSILGYIGWVYKKVQEFAAAYIYV